MRTLTAILFWWVLGLVVHAQPSLKEEPFKITVKSKLFTPQEVLSKYIQIKSVSGHEANAGKWIKDVCNENGLYIQSYGNADGNFNFAASLYPLTDSLPNIILLNHIDVVPEGDVNLWSNPPYSGHICDDYIWGRGAFDNKGVAIMQLFALLKFKDKTQPIKPSYNVTFLAVSCEEAYCAGGVVHVLKNHLQELNTEIVIGEGATELNCVMNPGDEKKIFGVATIHKRALWLELRLDIGCSGHGSVTPHEYANQQMIEALQNITSRKAKAIYNEQNLNMLNCLSEQEKGITKFILKNPRFFKPLLVPSLRNQAELFALFSNTITITAVKSDSSSINQIPQGISAILDCRLLPNYSRNDFLDEIENLLDNDKIQINIIKEMKKGINSDKNSTYFEAMSNAIKSCHSNSEVYPIMLPSFSDVGEFRRYGLQGLEVIPVEFDTDCIISVHAENERIPIAALEEGINVYQKFLENVCLK